MEATFNGNDRGTVFSSMGFVGIVIGQLSFGWIVDKVGRRNSMFIANIIVIIVVYWRGRRRVEVGRHDHGRVRRRHSRSLAG